MRHNPAMPNARILREITDAVRVLHDRADAAGSAAARSILTMSAQALHDLAVQAERDGPLPMRTPAGMMRRLGKL